jgi:hypothetical protein
MRKARTKPRTKPKPPAHWRRPLKTGGVEFFVRAGDGQYMKGSASSVAVVEFLQAAFERHTGATLPEPEYKEVRGK